MMGKPTIQHRGGPPRVWRYALALGIFLQGAFASLRPPAAYAAGSDAITLGVTVGNPVPPAAITDLLASPDLAVQGSAALSWTAPQGNVGGVPINNWPVGAYSVRYATFSVDSLAGDTTSWWNATAASNITLQPPSYTPKAPGQFEGLSLAGLTMGVRYYFAVKSISQTGVISPIDTESATPGQQASILLSASAPVRPHAPAGLLGTMGAGHQFTITWHSVDFDTTQNPVVIDHYRVDRYSVIGGTVTASILLPANTLTFSQSSVTTLTYYRIVAISNYGVESDPSLYIDSAENIIATADDDTQTRVTVPRDLAFELMAAHNRTGEDLTLRMVHRSQDEVDTTLRSYKAIVASVRTGNEVVGFAFSSNGISVQLGYGALLGAGRFNGNQEEYLQHPDPRASAGTIAQIISVYWFNGANYVKISDPVLTSGQSIAVSVRNLGIYQIRAVRIGNAFQLVQGSPYPRIITPNDPSQNNRVFFFFDNPTDEQVSGTIYDIRGAKVRELQVDSLSPTSNALVWNGRDSQGAVVPSGVYLYKIQAGKQSVTGTVVVAR